MLSSYRKNDNFKSILLASYSTMVLAPLSLAAAVAENEPNNNQGLSKATSSQAPTRANVSQARASRKLGPHMGALLAPDSMASRSSGATRLGDTPFMQVKYATFVQIYITLDVITEFSVASLQALGVETELVNRHLNNVQGWASVSAIEALLNNKHVVRIETAKYAHARAGSALTQGDAIIKSNLLQQLGFREQNIKVGIVSDGSNDWTAARASGNLPSSVTSAAHARHAPRTNLSTGVRAPAMNARQWPK